MPFDLTDETSFVEFPPSLFAASGGLNIRFRNRYPRDKQFFDRIRFSQLLLESFQDNVMPQLVSRNSFLRERDETLPVAKLSLNEMYVPLLSAVTSSLTQAVAARTDAAFRTQDERLTQFDNKMRILVQSVDSLAFWATKYRATALDLLRLSDVNNGSLKRLVDNREADNRLRLRNNMLNREYQRLLNDLHKIDTTFTRIKRDYLEKFQAEISQRDFVVSVLTQYLTNALFLPVSKDGVSKKNIPPLEGRPIRDYLNTLLPLYISFRNTIEEYGVEKQLVNYLEEYSKAELRKEKRNVLVTKYLRDASWRKE